MANKFNLQQVKKNLDQLKKTLPKKVADESRSFFLKSFKDGGFNNGSVQKWKEVKRRIPGTKEYKYPKTKNLSRRSKPILVDTGRLRNSIRVQYVSFGKSIIASDVPYAQHQNSMRKFIGKSRALDDRIIKIINIELKKIFKAS